MMPKLLRFPPAALWLLLGTVLTLAPASAFAADNEAALAAGNNEFTFDLLTELSKQPGNIFFSPFSISSALSMTTIGATGPTKEQLLNVFHWQNISDLPGAMQELNESLAGAVTENQPQGDPDQSDSQPGEGQNKSTLKFSAANSLWIQIGYDLLPSFTGAIKEHFDAELQRVNFKTAAEDARGKINRWVEAKTNDKIKNLLQPGTLQPDTRLVLVNAVYFLATWQEQFKKVLSKPGNFNLGGGKTKSVTFMNQTHDFAYAETSALQLVELPYTGGRLAMTIALPKATADAATSQLTGKDIFAAIEAAEHKSVQLELPKFKMESSFSLQDALKKLGVRDAFAAGVADFSPMNGNREFFIGNVIHKAFIDVDENGTEAAAATAVVMRAGAAFMPQTPVIFRADRPFLFLIRDVKDQTILFAGRVSDPS